MSQTTMGGKEAAVVLVSRERNISSGVPCLGCFSESVSGSGNICACWLGETGKERNRKFSLDLSHLWTAEVTQRGIFKLMGWAWDHSLHDSGAQAAAWTAATCLELGTRCAERVKGLQVLGRL